MHKRDRLCWFALVAFGFYLPLGGCAATQPSVWADELPLPGVEGEVVIAPRDVLNVDVANQRELSGEFPVRDDGTYLQPTLGSVPAAGLDPSALAAELGRRLKGIIVDARVTVTVARRAPARVHVVGEVRTPGSYELDRDRSLHAALAAAGWVTEFAGEDGIYVVRPRETPARIRFRLQALTAAEPHSTRFRLRDGDVVVVE